MKTLVGSLLLLHGIIGYFLLKKDASTSIDSTAQTSVETVAKFSQYLEKNNPPIALITAAQRAPAASAISSETLTNQNPLSQDEQVHLRRIKHARLTALTEAFQNDPQQVVQESQTYFALHTFQNDFENYASHFNDLLSLANETHSPELIRLIANEVANLNNVQTNGNVEKDANLRVWHDQLQILSEVKN